MDIFTHDLSLFDFNLSDTMIESLPHRHDSPPSSPSTSSAAAAGPSGESNHRAVSPPRHRHDGRSPLPLGMDWSLPPSKWVSETAEGCPLSTFMIGIQSCGGLPRLLFLSLWMIWSSWFRFEYIISKSRDHGLRLGKLWIFSHVERF